MSTDKGSEENIQDHSDAYYEELACQEEIYMEEIEERARAVLISEQPSLSPMSVDVVSLEVKCSLTDAVSNPDAHRGDEKLKQAAEELITGDSDDPPLSDDAVEKMFKAG